MKDLIIPNKVESAVNLSDITHNFEGLIIAYKDTEAAGYINWFDGSWNYSDSINYTDPLFTYNTLKDCIDDIVTAQNITNFKVIEFK